MTVQEKAIAYRSLKQLLGENYRLLNRQRQQKQALSHLRHKAQKRSADNQKGESNLGEYIDRLIAKAIVELAKQYQVSAIAIPKIEDMREIVQSEIKAKAEAKIPGYEEGQKKYAKQYRINIHNWSYGRLIENITNQANKSDIAIAEVKQPVRGSPYRKSSEIWRLQLMYTFYKAIRLDSHLICEPRKFNTIFNSVRSSCFDL